MVIGYHINIGAYGFWLPNDPRGSWSETVWAPHLRRFGPATKVETRRSVASRKHDYQKRVAATAKRHSSGGGSILWVPWQSVQMAVDFGERRRLRNRPTTSSAGTSCSS